MRKRFVGAMIIALLLAAQQFITGARADILLGPFNFASTLFGNTVTESAPGTYAASNWLNVVNTDPGNPGYLTGANFDTGVANIGLEGPVSYTIGYATPIVNGAGDDLGVVVARFSTDSLTIAFSTDGGVTFGPNTVIDSGSAIDSLVEQSYFYAGSGPFGANLFVHPLDLSDFGFAPDAQIDAIRVTGTEQLDLIRVAGFDAGESRDVPEPAALLLLGIGLSCAAAVRRLRA